MKKQLIKFFAVAAIFAASTAAHAQNFFTNITDGAAGLSSDQTAKLANMRSNPIYSSVQMVQMANFATYQQDGHITINLPGEAPLTAYASTIQAPSASLAGNFVWEGPFVYDVDTNNDGINDVKENAGNMVFYHQNGNYFGGFWTPSGNWYELMSFDNGKNVLVTYSAIAKNNTHECGNPDADKPTTTERTSGTPCNVLARVMFVYTPEAEAQVPSITNLVNRCMGDLNGTINNDNGYAGNWNCKFELAGIHKIFTFPQDPSSENCKIDVAGNPEILTAADEMRADIIVYLAHDGFPSDNAWGNSFIFKPQTPVAIYRIDNANSNYGTIHEIGHVLGGRHQQHDLYPALAGDDTPVEAHGYKVNTRKFLKTYVYQDIMHELVGYERTHIYSTPDQPYGGKAIGKVGTNDVFNTVLTNICTVSDIRPDTSIYFTAQITAPTLALTGATLNLHCTPHNGTPAYTYKWQISTDGDNWTVLSSTNDNATCTMPAQPHLYVMCELTDLNNRKALGFKTVVNKSMLNYDPITEQPSHLRLYIPHDEVVKMLVAPNPAANEVGIAVDMPKSALSNKHSIIITDAVGKVVYSSNLENETFATLQVDVTNFTSGIYFVKLLGGNETQTEKLVITK